MLPCWATAVEIEMAGGGGAAFAATVAVCRCCRTKKPMTAASKSSTSISHGARLLRPGWTTGATGDSSRSSSADSSVCGAATSSTRGSSSIDEILCKTRALLLLVVCLACQLVAKGWMRMEEKTECGWNRPREPELMV